MKILSLLQFTVILVFLFMGSTRSNPLGMFQHFEVHIINNFNSSAEELILDCKSGDNDLGEHFLDRGEDWHWKFRINLFRSTLFFCDVKWGETTKSLTVFDTDTISYKCENTSTCFWSVREEGFFLSCDGENYVKQHGWY